MFWLPLEYDSFVWFYYKLGSFLYSNHSAFTQGEISKAKHSINSHSEKGSIAEIILIKDNTEDDSSNSSCIGSFYSRYPFYILQYCQVFVIFSLYSEEKKQKFVLASDYQQRLSIKRMAMVL